MRNVSITLLATVVLAFNQSCSSDSNEGPNEEISTPFTSPQIDTYSSSFGYSGDIITVTGKDFPASKADIKVDFDGQLAEIVSSSKTEIQLKLPEVSEITKAEWTINGENATILVEQDRYEGKIHVHPKTKGEWTKSSPGFDKDPDNPVTKLQVINDLTYYKSYKNNGSAGSVIRTLDGGITWQRWSSFGVYGAFHANESGTGWSSFIGMVLNIPAEGTNKIDTDIFAYNGESNGTNGSSVIGVYVDSDLKRGVAVFADRVIFTTEDGVNFSKAYDDSQDQFELYTSFSLDADHFWAGGKNYATKEPLLIYTNGDNRIWNVVDLKETDITGPAAVRNIKFADVDTGFVLVYESVEDQTPYRLYKTIDGGATWVKTDIPENFTDFTFKDKNIGWATASSKIYKTTDGGATWNLDFTHDENIIHIAYTNNFIYAYSENSMLKYFEE